MKVCPACGDSRMEPHRHAPEEFIVCSGCGETWYPYELETRRARFFRRLMRRPHPNKEQAS
jgi:hypothetical protein